MQPRTATNDCVALITARGGSKRIPRKNLRELAGIPLIGWTIRAALAAKAVTKVIVSTDCMEIAEISRSLGAEVPFVRPSELSGDRSSHYDVVAHALEWLELTDGGLPELLCLLQPTSPLRSPDDIDQVVGLVCKRHADSGIAVSPVAVHPSYMYRLDDDGLASSYLPPHQGYLRSQDVEPLYYVNGAVYVLRPTSFRQRDTVLSQNPVAYVMPRSRSIDIDEEADFLLAEAALSAKSG